MEWLVFGGAYLPREICITKLIGLAYIWNKMYVNDLHKVFTETCHEDFDLSQTQRCKLKTQLQITQIENIILSSKVR